MIRSALLASGLWVLCAQSCYSQRREELPATLFAWKGEREPLGELAPIATDRPDFTEASSTVGLRVAQLEAGYTFRSSSDARQHSWGEPLLRYGVLANWLELRLAVFPTTLADRQSGTETTGVEDLYLGTKLFLVPQQGVLPETSLILQMTAPTGADSFTADRVLPGFNLLYGWDITDNLSCGASTQYNSSVNSGLVRYDEWAQSLTFGRSFTDRLGSYFEWFALFPHRSVDVLPEHYLDGGLIYLLSDDLQLDVRAGKGLSSQADDYFAGVGISIRYK